MSLTITKYLDMTSLALRRAGRGGFPPINVSSKPSGYASVGAKNKGEFYADGRKHMSDVIFSFTGKHQAATFREIALAGIRELWGSWLVASAVALSLWMCDGTLLMIEALFVAIAYGLSWYTAVRSGTFNYKLRPHCNFAITMGYLVNGEVGIFGALYYLVCQTLGTFVAAGMIGALIMGTPGSATKLPVPLPLTTTSSFTTVVCLELFGAALITFFVLFNEFVNTDGVTDSSVPGYDEKSLLKNFKKATLRTALLTAVLVIVGYQFKVVTFSNVAYGGGLFSGWMAGPSDLKTLVKLANLHSSDFANSVWDTRNGAAALYLLMPWVGGIVGAIIFWIVAFFGFEQDASRSDYRNKEARSYFGKGSKSESAMTTPETSGADNHE